MPAKYAMIKKVMLLSYLADTTLLVWTALRNAELVLFAENHLRTSSKSTNSDKILRPVNYIYKIFKFAYLLPS